MYSIDLPSLRLMREYTVWDHYTQSPRFCIDLRYIFVTTIVHFGGSNRSTDFSTSKFGASVLTRGYFTPPVSQFNLFQPLQLTDDNNGYSRVAYRRDLQPPPPSSVKLSPALCCGNNLGPLWVLGISNPALRWQTSKS